MILTNLRSSRYVRPFCRTFLFVFALCGSLMGCRGGGDIAKTSTEGAFVKKISNKDWRGIYLMGSQEEKVESGMDEEQYARLMSKITEGFPANLECTVFAHLTTRKTLSSFAASMKSLPKFAPDVSAPSGYLALHMRMSKGNWYPTFSDLPLQMLRFQKEAKEERRKRLLRAMQDARVDFLINLDNGRKLSLQDLQKVVDGNLKPMEAFR